MKIAYIITWNLRHNDGVTRKVFRQVQEWQELGHEVEIFCATELEGQVLPRVHFFFKRRIWSSGLFGVFFNRRAYARLCESVRSFTPDIVYLRWEFHKNALADLMKDVPTVIELNTHFLGELKRRARENWIERLRYWYYKLTHKKFNEVCSGFVSVSKEILEKGGYEQLGKPTCYIPNSIPIDHSNDPVSYVSKPNSIPRLVFISSGIQPWHGLENLLQLAEASKGELEFDLITGFDADETILPENVRFHAFLERDEFLNVFEGVVAGIGSAGLYENEMEEASVLKVREYLAAGLPVIVPYTDTAFMDDDLPDWILQVPNEPGSLLASKQKISDFVKVMNGRRIPLQEVSPYVGSERWETQRVDFMESVLVSSSESI